MALILKPGREKSLQRRHPGISSGAVARVKDEPASGATVDVLSASGDFLARAAYSPTSQIRARVWTFDDTPVDADFFRRKIRSALVERSTLNVQRSYECRHNLQYWRNLPYLGLGAGAHGFANGIRYSNVLRIKTYIERLITEHRTLNTEFPLTPATVNHHRLSQREQMQETMLTGLRLTREGVSDETFRARFGMDIAAAFPKEIADLLRLGLVEWIPQDTQHETRNRILRLTRTARFVSNQVFLRFVG